MELGKDANWKFPHPNPELSRVNGESCASCIVSIIKAVTLAEMKVF